MSVSSSLYFLPFPLASCPSSTYLTRPKAAFGRQRIRRTIPTKVVVASSSSRDHHDRHDGKLVDQDMIVLRKRIHEMKMMEEKHGPPSCWMEWEKQYYQDYEEDVCEAVGLLQSQLMKTRPSLALATALLVSASVPVSVGVIVFHLVQLGKGVLVGAFPF